MDKLDLETIAIQASDFRNENFLSSSEPINCKSILLKLGVLTVYRPLSDDFSGMCLKTEDKRFILINSNHSRGRQHFTIAHELYHLYIQTDFIPHFCNPGSSQIKDLIEKKADAFASFLLMPEMGVKKMIPSEELYKRKLSVSTILKLEHFFSVSHIAMLIRLRSLNLISQAQMDEYSSIQIKRTATEYGYNLSLYESGNEGLVIGDHGTRAKELFEQGRISEGHYRAILAKIGIDLTDFDNEDEN